MSKVKVIEYIPAKDGDYDTYKLSDGTYYYLWLRVPFFKSNQAEVHVMTNNDIEIGNVTLIKDIEQVEIWLNSKKILLPITVKQFLKPNKKYYFDKIIKFLIDRSQ
jgi:hypothetical protein